MDVRTSLAAQSYAATRPVTAPAAQPDGQGNAFAKAAGDFAQTLQQGEESIKAGLMGGADAHSLVQALAETQLAVETAVTVRDRVVEAYQEILRMPV